MGKNNKVEWFDFSSSYFSIAELACTELLDKKHIRYTDSFDIKRCYEKGDLFFPMIYNIKHGMECFLKDLILKLEKSNRITKDNKTHDIKTLFYKFEQLFKNNLEEIKQEIEKNSSNGHSNARSLINKESVFDKNKYYKNISELEIIILKYYHCDFGFDFNINDTQNDVFRFPSNTAKVEIQLNMGSLENKITKLYIEELRSEIKKIIELFYSLGFLIHVYSDFE